MVERTKLNGRERRIGGQAPQRSPAIRTEGTPGVLAAVALTEIDPDLALCDFESGLRRKGDIVRPAARSLLTVGAVADADTHQCAVILNRIAPQAHPPVRSVMVTLIPVSQKSPLVPAARLNSAKDGS